LATTASPPQATSSKEPDVETAEDSEVADDVEDEVDAKPPPAAARASERFFIVKSLTLQDLEQSVRNGIWATQSHNEEALNTAYEVGATFSPSL